jgi:hypothetical protein
MAHSLSEHLDNGCKYLTKFHRPNLDKVDIHQVVELIFGKS